NNNSHFVVVLPGQGDGSFGVPTRLQVGELPRDIVTDDFNHDGRPDLATGNRGTADVSVLLGLPGGGFAPEVRTGRIDGSAITLNTADFDRDGNRDLVVISDVTSLPGLTVLLGRGDGTFRSLGQVRPGGVPSFTAPGDFDGDGVTDLAVARTSSD